jgi:hypothetical protein
VAQEKKTYPAEFKRTMAELAQAGRRAAVCVPPSSFLGRRVSSRYGWRRRGWVMLVKESSSELGHAGGK